jgi:cytochrome c553
MMTFNFCARKADKRNTLRGCCLFLLCVFPVMATVAQPKSPEQMVVSCIPCHGANGSSLHASWPNLAGQDKQYLVTQLKAFRDGQRRSAMMYPMAFDLTDKDIDDIADYFHQLKCK